MRSKTLIALAVAGLLAAPAAFAAGNTSSGTGVGPSGMDDRSADERTPPVADTEKTPSGKSTSPKAHKRSSKRDAERISRNDRGTTSTEPSPNMSRDPDTPGNPPKQGGSPEPQ